MRRDSAANSSANASAPIVVSPIDTSVIGPYPASDEGRLKTPTPMMLPMIRATAAGSPNPGPEADDTSDGASFVVLMPGRLPRLARPQALDEFVGFDDDRHHERQAQHDTPLVGGQRRRLQPPLQELE